MLARNYPVHIWAYYAVDGKLSGASRCRRRRLCRASALCVPLLGSFNSATPRSTCRRENVLWINPYVRPCRTFVRVVVFQPYCSILYIFTHVMNEICGNVRLSGCRLFRNLRTNNERLGLHRSRMAPSTRCGCADCVNADATCDAVTRLRLCS